MHRAFDLPVGYSDHTEGVVAGTVAATLGATMIEKHYTLDKGMQGPDHKASADIPELTQLVQAMRDVSRSLGDGIKRPVAAEAKNRPLIRKSFTCGLESMAAGTLIEASMLGIKRPLVDGAVEPFDLDKIVGQRISKSKRFDTHFYTESVLPEAADKLFFEMNDALAFKPDAVIISSPASEHVRHAVEFINNGA
jgi:sialic acid synthase SpsE